MKLYVNFVQEYIPDVLFIFSITLIKMQIFPILSANFSMIQWKQFLFIQYFHCDIFIKTKIGSQIFYHFNNKKKRKYLRFENLIIQPKCANFFYKLSCLRRFVGIVYLSLYLSLSSIVSCNFSSFMILPWKSRQMT